MLKPKEVLLSDGETYAPAFVPVNLDGAVIDSGGGGGSVDITTLSKETTQQQVLTAVQDADNVVTATLTTSGQEIIVDTQGKNTVGIQITGDGEGLTLLLSATINDSDWFGLSDQAIDSPDMPVNSNIRVGGFSKLKLRLLNISNGSVSVTMRASSGIWQTQDLPSYDSYLTQLGYESEAPLENPSSNGTLTSITKGILKAVQPEVFRTDNTPTLTTLNSTGAWIDNDTVDADKFELVLALTTAATVPAVALEMDYSYDGTAIVRTPTLTGVVNRAVSLGVEGRPTRVRCVVTTAGVTLGAGAKVIITGSK
jgi:hypothetical protein